MARSRKKPFVLALVVSLGCARTGLELAELGAIDEAGGTAGTHDPSGTGGTNGLGGSGGTAGTASIGCAGSEPTWSCAPAVPMGTCCDANGPFKPQCTDVCQLGDGLHGLPCGSPGQTKEAPVVNGISRLCENGLFACYVQACTCGCREGTIAPVPGLSETCAPTLFSNAHHFPNQIVLDDEFAYWTVAGICPSDDGSGKVMGARRSDGSAAFAILDQPCPRSLAEAGDALYWVAGDAIRTGKKGGGDASVFFDGQFDLAAVHADAEHVYWRGDRTISRQRRNQTAPVEIFTDTAYRVNASRILDFELDDRYVYWLEEGFFEAIVYRADKADSSRGPEPLVQTDRAVELAVSSEGIFWIEELDYPRVGIFALGWDDEEPTLLIERPDQVDALAAFRDEAYWVEGGDDEPGFVHGIRAGGNQPFLSVGDQNGPRAIAVDEQYVFWINQNTSEVAGHAGEIKRVCRP